MAVERYYNTEGELAVLISKEYGAGWSTWNDKYGIDLAIDKRIVEVFLEYEKNRKEIKLEALNDWFKSIGYEDVYFGGWSDIEIEWIDKGTAFRIDEYDGAEVLHKLNQQGWCIA